MQKDLKEDIDSIKSVPIRVLLRSSTYIVIAMAGFCVILLKVIQSSYESSFQRQEIRYNDLKNEFKQLQKEHTLFVLEVARLNAIDKENSRMRDEIRREDSIRLQKEREISELKRKK